MFWLPLLAANGAAHAAPQSFDIVYKGFYSVDDKAFLPDKTLNVSLTIDDLDGNGSFSENEVKALKSSNIDYKGICTVEHCLEEFHWNRGSLPYIQAVYHEFDGFTNTLTIVTTGVEYREFVQTNFGFRYDAKWTWTADTQTTITPASPVPEPSAWVMLCAGLAGLGALSRRRAANTATAQPTAGTGARRLPAAMHPG